MVYNLRAKPKTNYLSIFVHHNNIVITKRNKTVQSKDLKEINEK